MKVPTIAMGEELLLYCVNISKISVGDVNVSVSNKLCEGGFVYFAPGL